MSLLDKIKCLFKREDDLRAKCVEAYGVEFGEMYDTLNSGGTIGGFLETAMFIDMLEAVKRGEPLKLDGDRERDVQIRVDGVYIPIQ